MGLGQLRHRKSDKFRDFYRELPKNVQAVADKNFALLKRDPHHPSLHFKKIGRRWSVRVGLDHRALALDLDGDLLWYWIGPHAPV